jgi:hypothetical protein
MLGEKITSQEEVLDLMRQGWELGQYGGGISRSRTWLQKQLCCGGDMFDVHGGTFNALLRKRAVVALPPREKDRYWLRRYGLAQGVEKGSET